MPWINTNGGHVLINKADHDNLSKKIKLMLYWFRLQLFTLMLDTVHVISQNFQPLKFSGYTIFFNIILYRSILYYSEPYKV